MAPRLYKRGLMPLPRPILLGTAALVLLSLVVGGAWWGLGPGFDSDDALPLPPEAPRLVDAPDYERCLLRLRDDPEGARALAEAWEAAGGGEGARHCAALALIPLGEPGRAAPLLQALARASDAGPAARAAVFGQAGQAWMQAGDTAQALAAISAALALTPRNPDLLVDRAIAASALMRFDAALADLDAAVAIDPQRAEAWVLRAATLRRLDRVAAAITDITRAVALEPDNAEALLERGILRQLRGDAAGARADWTRAMELAPDSATADLAMQNLALSEAGPQRN